MNAARQVCPVIGTEGTKSRREAWPVYGDRHASLFLSGLAYPVHVSATTSTADTRRMTP